MSIPRPTGSQSGIALIIVMLVIVVLSVLAAGFAYSMKVETRLAQGSVLEPDLHMLALSGLELGRYVLGQQLNIPGESRYDALNQKWAGGPGGTNDLLAGISLEENVLGRGHFTVRITDLERKVNINFANRDVLERALDGMGVDLFTTSMIVDSIEDWRDRNLEPRPSGAESEDYYLQLSRPHQAKDGPLDDLTELLRVKGMTPEIYWGPGRNSSGTPLIDSPASTALGALSPAGAAGLVDLFNTLGRLQININTAPPEVLRLLPGVDANLAVDIVRTRAGLDGFDGNEDDTPFQSAGELINVPGMNPQMVQQIQRLCAVRSFGFEIRVEAWMGDLRRRLLAIVVRTGPANVQILNMRWE